MDRRLKRAIETHSLPRELLICGPAGTGKTYSTLTVLHVLAADYPNLRILIVRKTRVSLTDSALVTFEQQILPADGMSYIAAGVQRKNRSSYRYPNGSEIILLGMDRPERIGSTAWDIIYPNEAIELDEAHWETLSSRLNRPGRPSKFGFLIGDTNPGDPSHWLKKRCDDGRTALWDTAHQANPAMYANGQWTEDGAKYLDRLNRQRGTRRKRLLEGIWAAGEGQWFETFSDDHVNVSAEYDPRYPVHLAVDSGVETGAVWFQVREGRDEAIVTVFGEYYSYDVGAFRAAKEIQAISAQVCGGRVDVASTDPAGNSRTGIGLTVLAEYARAGLKLTPWPSYSGSKPDGLALLGSFVSVAPPGLIVHPRCLQLRTAFANYRRKKVRGQWTDLPEEPQHPHEDLMDALRGGLMFKYPSGRRPEPKLFRIHSSRIF